MSMWSRLVNVFRSKNVNRDIDDELQSHLDEARAEGRDPVETARAFGSPLRTRESVRDAILSSWLDSLIADAVFGWCQLVKHKTASSVAILSLGLGIGSCMAAFRLIDAMLLRPLPVSDPGHLYVLGVENVDENGVAGIGYSFSYPHFRYMRGVVKDRAELIAIDRAQRTNLTFGSDEETERVYRQYVSGWLFPAFGLNPALGRLFTEADDITPGGHPFAVLSYDYWTRRFGQDPEVIGRSFRNGNDVFRVLGVAPEGFTGTEPGTLTDVFIPTMMNTRSVGNEDNNWLRTWVKLKPGASPEQVRGGLQAAVFVKRQERAKSLPPGMPAKRIERYVSAPVVLEPAAAGISEMQLGYRLSLRILGILVALVLLIACANVANLMAAQAAARAREMALRVSIGAGRARLLQLVLMESVWIAALASFAGAAFAWWAAPFVTAMINPPDNPVRLIMPADWRVTAFGTGLAFAVTLLFGLAPALRASSVQPSSALKGGYDPHAGRKMMSILVGAQVVFCFVVHLIAGLFVSTFERMENQPIGFSAEQLLTLDTVARTLQPDETWYRAADHLRSLPGVESAAAAQFPLMSGAGTNRDVWANGHAPDEGPAPWFLGVSPGWLSTMKIPILEGVDFRSEDAFPLVAAVNQSFAKRYFDGRSPVGRTFDTQLGPNRTTIRIVALVADARYTGMRGPIPATAYVPFHRTNYGPEAGYRGATFLVRTKHKDPLSLAVLLRQEVSRANTDLRVANIRTQEELVRQHTIRERLLAMLSMFFASVALILAAVGLYGLLDYAVLARRRELGIRIALGARAGDVVWRVTAEVLMMLLGGATIGLALGIASERYLGALLYQVKATEPMVLAIPALMLGAATILAAFPPALRATRIDPSKLLRSD